MPESNDWNRPTIEAFRANGGKVGGIWEGRPLLLLTTTGAKSGRRRTHPLMYLRDDDLSSIRPERLNRRAIPIIAVRHIFSFMKQLMPTWSAFLLRARLVLCHSIPSQHMTSSNLHMYTCLL